MIPCSLRRSLPVALLAVLLTAPAASARIAATPEPGWMPDAAVSALASDGSTAFLAGTIYDVGPHTGSGAVLSARDGHADEGVPPITGGAVNAVVGDGRGGWYVGGSFDHVGDVARAGLVHLFADGRVDPAFDPRPDGTVRALALRDRTLYAAGDFASIGGATRDGLAAVGIAGGAATPWHPTANGAVDALAAGPDRVVLGGRFTSVDGLSRGGAAAVDRSGGDVLAWDAALDGPVRWVALAGDSAYLAGDFRHAGGTERPGLAEVSAADGAVAAWVPAVGLSFPVVAGGRIYGGVGPSVVALDRGSGAVVAGNTGSCGPCDPGPVAVAGGAVFAFLGRYALIDDPGSRLEAYRADDLAVRPWGATPPIAVSPTAARPNWGVVRALAVQGDRVFIGGGFDIAGGQRHVGLAGLDLRSGRMSAADPGVTGAAGYNPQVPAVAAGDGFVVADGFDFGGGAFSTSGAGRLWRFYVGTDVPQISALAVAGPTLYVGGYSEGSAPGARGAFAVALRDRAPLGWRPTLEGSHPVVRTILPAGDTVYLGGTFTSGSHRNLIAVDATTGAIRADFAPDPDGDVRALALHHGRLYAGGTFTSAGGAQRRNLAALDPHTGAATPWAPDPDGEVRAVAARGRTIIAGGAFTTIAGASRHNLAALRELTGRIRRWAPEPDGPINALVASAQGVLVGGAFTHISGTFRVGFAQFRARGR